MKLITNEEILEKGRKLLKHLKEGPWRVVIGNSAVLTALHELEPESMCVMNFECYKDTVLIHTDSDDFDYVEKEHILRYKNKVRKEFKFMRDMIEVVKNGNSQKNN